MADGPDLSKIIGVIMEHPEIIASITRLVGESSTPVEESTTSSTPEVKDESVTVSTTEVRSGGLKSHRSRLLGAMRPYLSESRARAVDTLMTVTDILESMRNGG